MAYSDFTLNSVTTIFDLTINETSDLFAGVEEIAPSDLLQLTLKETLPLATAINTEKARSELIIAPILLEVRRHLHFQISLFSGIDFNVAPEKGLAGFCDFIISKSTEQFFIQSPVVTLVEAKNENIKAGLGQCVAEMVAAQLFNQQSDVEIQAVYGVVTTGEVWRFLKLEVQTVFIDATSYYVSELEKILGIFVSSLNF
jgi:hypothetical protein